MNENAVITFIDTQFVDLTSIPREAAIPMYHCRTCYALTLHPQHHAQWHRDHLLGLIG